MDFVFSSLPQEVETLCSWSELQSVKDLLEQRKGVWISAAMIAEELQWPRQRTAEKVRRAVKELQLLGVPIVGGHAGFTWAIHQRMLDVYVESLLQRDAGLHRTIVAVKAIRIDERQERLGGAHG